MESNQAITIILVIILLYVLYLAQQKYFDKSPPPPPLGPLAKFVMPPENATPEELAAFVQPGWECDVPITSSPYWTKHATQAGLDPTALENCGGEWHIRITREDNSVETSISTATCIAAGNAEDLVPSDLKGAPAVLVASGKADTNAIKYADAGQIGEAYHQFLVLKLMSVGDPDIITTVQSLGDCIRKPAMPACVIL